MRFQLKEAVLWVFFRLIIIFKFCFALVQVISGLIVLVIPREDITRFLIWIAQGELLEDPRDYIATHVISFAQHYSISVKALIVSYLLVHGLVKIYLLYGLWRNKPLAYKLSAAVFTVFLLYQVYRFTITHSAWLILLSIIDILYILTIVHEYKYRIAPKAKKSSSN